MSLLCCVCDKLPPKLQADGHKVLIVSQFRIMLNIIEDYMVLRGFSFDRVDGAVTGNKSFLIVTSVPSLTVRLARGILFAATNGFFDITSLSPFLHSPLAIIYFVLPTL